MYVLGLTGSIGMGKSTVGGFFQDASVPLLDADQVVHTLYSKGGSAVAPVEEMFPDCVVDGAIDRRALSKHVLGQENAAALKKLEAVVHPLVAQERVNFIREQAAAGHNLVVVDIPLLFETGLESAVDGICVVSAPPDVQRQRVLARPGMTEQKLADILQRQMPDEEKRRRADYTINTDCSLEETQAQILHLIETVKGKEGKVAV